MSKSGVHGNCLTSFQRKLLEKNLDDKLPWQYSQRIEIMLLADEGKTQSHICKAIGCSPGTARHWILVAKSGQAHQWNNHPIGCPQEVNEQYLERLKELVTNRNRTLYRSFNSIDGSTSEIYCYSISR
ncbi:helix-turn-helix domain-containing protein [Okeania sp. KiyG1]|uniref:helix-turn-helix domain-containing protein n=1 Tax=Okeania sp. KiyG1 TaxID=2720165 RepID=UPI0019B67D75|nr:helix-turn-helix domain-containing protein [Okeania sp. KiyG1]GGA00932.1 hypothetical protein CYANOKiyG1_12710 [Okeania sp. KiyG1]